MSETESVGIRRGLLIGAGYFSNFHLDAWKRLGGVEIACVCDRELAKAQRQADAFGIASATSDLEQALARSDIDFIDIATGPTGRPELVQQVLARKLPTICQKPLGDTFELAKQIVDAAIGSDCPFMIHENFRFQPWYREIKRLIDSGAIGDRIQNIAMRTRMGDGWGADAYLDRQPYFRTMPRLLVHETGVHFIDTFRFLAGEIIDCTAELQTRNDAILGEDAGWIRLGFPGGATAVWDADRYHESLAENPRYTFGDLLLEADGGSLWLDSTGKITIKPLGEDAREHTYSPSRLGFAGDCVHACQRHFLDMLDGKVTCETSPEEYLKTLRVVEAVYESNRTRQRIRLEGATDTGSSTRRVVDLSLPVSAALRGVEIDVAKELSKDGWNATTLKLYSHAGTHMDAPRHFVPDAPTLDAQDLSVCIGKARVIDLSPAQPAQLIGVDEMVRAAGDVRPGERLLLRTDWHHRAGTDEYRDALPRISAELARWLVEKQVALVGVEPPSVADVNNANELTEVHQILFHGGVLIVEGLANLDRLVESEVEFIALPLNIVGGDGCPVRAIAIENSEGT